MENNNTLEPSLNLQTHPQNPIATTQKARENKSQEHETLETYISRAFIPPCAQTSGRSQRYNERDELSNVWAASLGPVACLS